jgi:hypothetical protein
MQWQLGAAGRSKHRTQGQSKYRLFSQCFPSSHWLLMLDKRSVTVGLHASEWIWAQGKPPGSRIWGRTMRVACCGNIPVRRWVSQSCHCPRLMAPNVVPVAVLSPHALLLFSSHLRLEWFFARATNTKQPVPGRLRDQKTPNATLTRPAHWLIGAWSRGSNNIK